MRSTLVTRGEIEESERSAQHGVLRQWQTRWIIAIYVGGAALLAALGALVLALR